jgi:hypothetical protein
MTVEYVPERDVEGQRLGWHRDHKPENKDWPIRGTPAFALAPLELRAAHWPTATTPGILFQGQIGACTGNGTTSMCSTPPLIDRRRRYDEALALALYKGATVRDGIPGVYPPSDTGSTTVAVLAEAKARGLISSYRWAFGTDEALHTLAYIGAIVVAFDWWEGFDTPRPNGELVIAGASRGGHLLCADTIQPADGWGGGGFIEGPNSWGNWWGPIGGRWRMSWATLRHQLEAGGEVGVGLKPRRRRLDDDDR